MNDQAPTLSYPFGRDVNTLVVCMNEDHRRHAIKNCGIKARYETIGSALCGCRYNHVVVLRTDQPFSDVERRIIREDLPTKLSLGGKLYIW